MSNRRLDIDAIVREVLQRLMQHSAAPPEPRPASAAVNAPASEANNQPSVTGTAVSSALPAATAAASAASTPLSAAGTPLSAAGTPVSAAGAPAPPTKPADPPGTLRLAERLITLATLEGRLRGVRRVAVGRSAVVTPSVRDALGRQGIALVREDLQCAGPATLSHCSVRVTGADCSSAALSAKLGLQVISLERVTEAVKQSVRDVQSEQKLAVVITRQTALAVCLANRHRRVRAAIARCEETVRDAVGSIGANLLVIDPRRAKAEELPRLIRIFAEGGNHDCPHEFAQLLEETV